MKITINDFLEFSKHINLLNSDITVETDYGYNKILACDITAKNSKILHIILDNLIELKCSPEHLLFTNDNWVKANMLDINDYILTKYGYIKIKSIDILNYTEDLLDLQVVGQEYYTNNIVSHNSSLIETLDLSVYGEVQNKQGKRLSQKNFPNRNNGKLEVEVTFQTDEICTIKRNMQNLSSPLKTELIIDGVPYGKANKIDDKILEKIGFDYKTYKSFISMNVNNFKNFISLTPEEKRILLDKLFSLEQINDLNKILKQLQKTNDISFNSLKDQISIYTENIESLRKTINEVNEKKKINNDVKQAELKVKLNEYKIKFEQTEKNKMELEQDINDFKEGIEKLTLKSNNIKRDISDVTEKINLYKGGKCPTCLHDLSEELNLLPELEEQLQKTKDIKTNIDNKITKARKELEELQASLRLIQSEHNNILQISTTIKNELKVLKEDKNDNLDEFETNIKLQEGKKKDKENQYLDVQKLKHVYDILLPIWGEQGIKRDIIDSIITPLNEFIAEDLVHLKTRFRVELDNNFDAHIYEWNNEIDPDTLSTGEAKKINLIIMLAYIKMLRMKRDINILFLDEVFSSIDVQGIEDILILFKKFANERNVNVFMVHHSELKDWFFDKILIIKKNTFSYIDEKII